MRNSLLAVLGVGLLSAAAGAGIDHALQAAGQSPSPTSYRMGGDSCVHRQSDGRGWFCEGTCISAGNVREFPVRKANAPTRSDCFDAIEAECARAR